MDIDSSQIFSTFKTKGYAVVRNCIAHESCDKLRESAAALVSQIKPGDLPDESQMSQPDFSWENYYDKRQQRRCFFFENGNTENNCNMKYDGRPVKKISYALHYDHESFREFSCSLPIKQLLYSLQLFEAYIVQSMYLVKHPFSESSVMAHQDLSYIYTHDKKLVALWVALDNFTTHNGCLWVLPEGHNFPLKYRLLRNRKGNLEYQIFDDASWDEGKMIPLEVPKGSVILLDGRIPHMTRGNTTFKPAHAFAMHVIDGLSQYCRKNWLQQCSDYPFLQVPDLKQ